MSHSGFLNTAEEEPRAMRTHHHLREQEDGVTATTETTTVQRVRETPGSNLFGDETPCFDHVRLTPQTTHQRDTPWAGQQPPTKRLNRVKASETTTPAETHAPRLPLTSNEFKEWKAIRNAVLSKSENESGRNADNEIEHMGEHHPISPGSTSRAAVGPPGSNLLSITKPIRTAPPPISHQF